MILSRYMVLVLYSVLKFYIDFTLLRYLETLTFSATFVNLPSLVTYVCIVDIDSLYPSRNDEQIWYETL
jgi:hypothetical protein